MRGPLTRTAGADRRPGSESLYSTPKAGINRCYPRTLVESSAAPEHRSPA